MTLKISVSKEPRQASIRSGGAANRGFRPRRRKRKVVACLLAAGFPGLGHLYLKLPVQGTTLISLFLLDISSLIYFSSVRAALNLPLLVLLGLMIPIIYFYSIYTVLQAVDLINARIRYEEAYREEGEASIDAPASQPQDANVREGVIAGLMLIGSGAVIFLLRMDPFWLESYLYWFSGYLVSAVLTIGGLLMIGREGRRRFVRSGRFTAAALIAAVGLVLLSDRITGQNHLFQLPKWWPLLLILLGVDYIGVLFWYLKTSGRRTYRIRVDIKGIILSVAIALSVFAVTQQDHYMHLWNRVSLDLASSAAEFSQAEGYHLKMPVVRVPIELDTEQVVINGVNGDIDIKRATTEDIQIQGMVWVDELSEEEAAPIAEKTEIAATVGKSLTLTVKNQLYGASGKRHPRVNLTILLPENRFLDLDISTTEGSIKLTNVQALKQIKLQTANGNLRLWEIGGDVTAKVLNGDAEFYRIFGNLTIDTQGGNLKANGIDGDAALSTKVGDISLVNAEGEITAGTRNGNIVIDGVPQVLQAESLNGKIRVSSNLVGGDWDVYSGVGEVTLEIPVTGDYTLEGSSGYGDIQSDLPFPIEDKVITGIQGNGEHMIKVDGNSNLIVNYR